MKIYISGAITGVDESIANAKFQSATLKWQSDGHEVVNPLWLYHSERSTWSDHMRTDIRALCLCDAIYMLNNWETSKGAKLEHRIATELGMKIYYQPQTK